MKNSDIAMIILIASVSVLVAFGVIGAIPALKAPSEPVSVDTIDLYTTTIDPPSPKIFNAKAINPTVDVTIGGAASDQ